MLKRTALFGLLILAAATMWPDTADAIVFRAWPQCGTNCHMARNQATLQVIPAQFASVAIFFVVSYVLGRLVRDHGWPVGYTRKILAGTLYAAPIISGYWWSIHLTPTAITISAAINLICVALMSHRFRSRSRFLATAFMAIDRPEDRPLTIPWLLSAITATWVVLVIWTTFFPAGHYFAVALFVSGVGDALAEPVGLKFGRHKYQVRALGTDTMYTRSLEGSACVFVSAIIAVLIDTLIVGGIASSQQFVMAIVLFPIVTTIVEAKSPHTWDQPFIVASCGLTGAFINWIA